MGPNILVLSLSSIELILLLSGLELSVADLGRGINELEDDLLVVGSLGSDVDLVSQDEWSGLGSNTASLDHDVVLFDLSIVRESTHRGDVLLGEVVLSSGVVLDSVGGSLA